MAPDFAAAIPTLLTAVDRYAAVLNKLASDIAATGTASLPMIPPSAGASTIVTGHTKAVGDVLRALLFDDRRILRRSAADEHRRTPP